MAQITGLKDYKGNCHCGLFRFTVETPELKNVGTCSCSICTRKACLWIWPIGDENLHIQCGDNELKKYEFGSQKTIHFFCPTCGSAVMARTKGLPKEAQLRVNARMLETDISTIESNVFSDKDFCDSQYQAPESEPSKGGVDEGMVVLSGNCHCGAVKYSVKTEPLDKQKIISCNCSLCSRNGDIFIYPKASSVRIDGIENLTGYGFLSQTSLHSFCKVCGVSVLVQVTEEGEDICPINIRTMSGRSDTESLVIIPYDGKNNEPHYVVGEKKMGVTEED